MPDSPLSSSRPSLKRWRSFVSALQRPYHHGHSQVFLRGHWAPIYYLNELLASADSARLHWHCSKRQGAATFMAQVGALRARQSWGHWHSILQPGRYSAHPPSWRPTPHSKVTPPPTPCPDTGLPKHANPVFPHFWVFFATIAFPVPFPIEKVVCSFVQAAGRVSMGGKVFGVAVIPCALVFWGPVALYCHVLRGWVGLCLQHVFCDTCRAVTRACPSTATPCFRTLLPPEPERGPC